MQCQIPVGVAEQLRGLIAEQGHGGSTLVFTAALAAFIQLPDAEQIRLIENAAVATLPRNIDEFAWNMFIPAQTEVASS